METTLVFAEVVTANFSSFINSAEADNNNNTTTTQTAPQAPPSRYPPGYFVVPEDVMFNFRITMYSAIIPVTAAIGLIGNAITFPVLLRHKMPKTTKMVLLAITVYDILNLIASILFSLVGLSIARRYDAGLQIARKAFPIFGSYLQFVFARISALMIVLVSLERFCAVFFPLKIKTIWSPKVMAVSIVVCNIIIFLVFLPDALKYVPKDIPIPNSTEVKTILVKTEIGQRNDLYTTFYSIKTIVTRLIPVFLVLACNIAISLSLYFSRGKRSKMTGGKTNEKTTDQRITRTLMSLSFVFLVCMMPNALVILIQLADLSLDRNNVYLFASILFFWLEVINSTVNFVIYILSSKQMRNDFKAVLGCGDKMAASKKYTSEGNTRSTAAMSMATVSGTVD